MPTVASRDGGGPVLPIGDVSVVAAAAVAGASVVTVTVYTDGGGSADMSVDSMPKIVVNNVWPVTVGSVPAWPVGDAPGVGGVPGRSVDDIRDLDEVRSVGVTAVGRPDWVVAPGCPHLGAQNRSAS